MGAANLAQVRPTEVIVSRTRPLNWLNVGWQAACAATPTDPRFTQMALDRWQRIAEGHNPQTEVDIPDFPPAKQLTAEIRRLLAGPGGAL